MRLVETILQFVVVDHLIISLSSRVTPFSKSKCDGFNRLETSVKVGEEIKLGKSKN